MPDMTVSRPGAERTSRDWLIDIACFVLALAIGFASSFENILDGLNAAQLVGISLVGVVASFSLWFRRRWPTAVVFGTMTLSIISPIASGAALISLFSVAIHRPLRIALLAGAFGLVTAPLYFEIFPSADPLWANMASLTFILAAMVGWGVYVRARRDLIASLRDRARQAEEDRDLRLAQAREQERARIAREMHDVLAHRISLVALNAGALEIRTDASPEEIRRTAGVVRDSAHQALDELRDVIAVLRDPVSGELAAKEPPQPTLRSIEELIGESRETGSEVAFESEIEDLDTVPVVTGRTAFRLVQEGLTNVRKHAPGGTSRVRLAGQPEEGLTVEVSNRRALLAPEPQPGIPGSGSGLIGLRERIDLAGGRLEYGPLPNGEFRLWAWLPWPA